MRKKATFVTSPKREPKRFDDFITIILLCDKAGHRMKSYGPTCLAEIGGHTLLDRQISSIKSVFSSFEIILCGGFESEKITKYIRSRHRETNIRVVENQIYPHSNCCESSRLCINNTNTSKLLICNGDLMLNAEVLSLVNCRKTCIFLEGSPKTNFEIGVVINERGGVENLSYGVQNTWAEMIYFNDLGIINSFRKVVSAIDFKTKFIFEAINELVKAKHQIHTVTNSGKPIIKIDNIKTYHEVRKSYESTDT